MPPNAANTKRYFLSYAHADQTDVDRFLAVMKDQFATARGFTFLLWTDKQIPLGQPWHAEIDKALQECDFGLLLVSPAFLASEFITASELPTLLAKTMVVPVVLHPIRFDNTMKLNGLEHRQCFFDSQGRTFDHCKDDTASREFANDLMVGILKLLETPPSATGREAYLNRLIQEQEAKAKLYSPLQAIASLRPAGKPLPGGMQFDSNLALLRHQFRHAAEKPEVRDYPDILQAFQGGVRRAALLGAPGAGKSTTLRRLAIDLATQAQLDPQAPLPLLATLGNWTGSESLAVFLATTAPELNAPHLNVILLLDGLNEVPTATRVAKASEVAALHKTQPLIVTCRREDYSGLDLGLDTLTLEPLPPLRIRDAVRHWIAGLEEPIANADRFFWQLASGGDPAVAQQLTTVLAKWQDEGRTEADFWSADQEVPKKTSGAEDDLWRRCHHERSLIKLAANLFMLTMLFWVWRENQAQLPRNRGDLFRLFVYNLLAREGLVHDPATAELTLAGEHLLRSLAALAWQMQRDHTPDEDDGVLTVVPRAAALATLQEPGLKHALDATILEGEAELRFRHQLLQEYFTAQALNNLLATTPAATLWPPGRWWQRTGWEETAVLLAGLHPADCSPVIRWLADAQPEVAAQCLAESGADPANKDALLADLQTRWLARLPTDPQPEARAAVGRALDRLHLDTRKGVGLVNGLPDIDWVQIPAGEFLYQENEKRKLAAFAIARYPVTHAQFQAFLDASDGYPDDRWWQALTDPDRTPQEPRWNESNHPRERVSWYEAMAFCAWLSHKLGREIRLPTEWQWERAARSTDGRAYPWGNEYVAGHANINETYQKAGPHYLARTSPVGIYPQGASEEGVLDLSGNVWEWCLNEHEKPDGTQPGGKVSRVLRGGAWFYFRVGARAVYRYHYHPGDRFNDFGFRVVCSSPIR